MLSYLIRLVHVILRPLRSRSLSKILFLLRTKLQDGSITLGRNVQVGRNVRVFVPMGAELVLEDDVYLADDVRLTVEVDRSISIGARTRIQSGSMLVGSISIGSDTILAPRVFASSGRHLFNDRPHLTINEQDRAYVEEHGRSWSRPITIGDDVWLGINVVVADGCSVGDGAVVGANSVVTTNIPSYEVWAGTPAVRKGARAWSPKD